MGEEVTSDSNPLRGLAGWGGPPAQLKPKTKTQTKMETTVEITGIDLGRIAFVYEKPYSPEAQKKDDRFKGKSYSVFSVQGKSFHVPSDSEVAKYLMNRKERSKIKTIFLLENSYEKVNANGGTTTTKTFTYDGFVTVEESLAYKQSSFEESVLDAKIQNILKGNFKAEAELSEEDVKALEQ
jgi:hypothetical protein